MRSASWLPPLQLPSSATAEQRAGLLDSAIVIFSITTRYSLGLDPGDNGAVRLPYADKIGLGIAPTRPAHPKDRISRLSASVEGMTV